MRSHLFRLQRLLVLYICVPVLLTTTSFDRAVAQSPYGYVTVYADEFGAACVLLDEVPRTFNVYVLHEEMDGVLSSEFSLEASDGFGCVYVAESIAPPFLSIGNTQDGISIAYAACLGGTRVLVTVTYDGVGMSAPCSYLEVVAHPDYAAFGILVQDCSFQVVPRPTRGRLHVNPDSSCPEWCVVSAEETTWGRVKALYRD